MCRYPLTPTRAALATLLVAFSALIQPARAQAVSTAPPSQGLALAVSFVPPDTDIAYLTDWTRIFDDMGSVYPLQPEIGDNDFVRRLAERHAAAVQFAIGSRSPWWMQEEWGWSFLDVDWELQFYPAGVVVGFNESFDPGPLLALFDEREYETDDHHGQATRHHAFDPMLSWLRPPLTAFGNIAYLEQQRVLVGSSTLEGLRALLDAHAGRSDPWPAADLALNLAQAAEPTMGAYVFPASAICGRLGVEEARLQTYRAAAVAYHRVGEELIGTYVLEYDDETTAALDLEPRQRIAGDDSSPFQQGVHFQSLTAEVVGNLLWLRLGSLDRPTRPFDMLNRSEVPFLGCPF